MLKRTSENYAGPFPGEVWHCSFALRYRRVIRAGSSCFILYLLGNISREILPGVSVEKSVLTDLSKRSKTSRFAFGVITTLNFGANGGIVFSRRSSLAPLQYCNSMFSGVFVTEFHPTQPVPP